MDIFASLDEYVSRLGNAGPALDDSLGDLIEDLRLVVGSYLGLTLSLRRDGYPVTVTALDDNVEPDHIRASLSVPLTTLADVELGSVLDLYAARPGAFVDLAADLCHALNLSPDQVVLDQNLRPPVSESALTGARDLAQVNRAIGILVSRGYTPEDARTELRRRADHDQTTVPDVARRLVKENSASPADAS